MLNEVKLKLLAQTLPASSSLTVLLLTKNCRLLSLSDWWLCLKIAFIYLFSSKKICLIGKCVPLRLLSSGDVTYLQSQYFRGSYH